MLYFSKKTIKTTKKIQINQILTGDFIRIRKLLI